MPRLTVTRRIALTILLGLFGSVVLVVLFSSAYWRVADRPRKPTADSHMFPAIALMIETTSDAALRARMIDVLKHHYPDQDLTVYTEAGELVATTMAEPFRPIVVGEADWSSSRVIYLETKERLVEGIPVVNSAGARFYAIHGYGEKQTPTAVAWWFWLSCAIPVVCCTMLSLLLARSITGPLDRIIGTSRALAAGQLSARAGITRRDELGLLASTLDQMAERIGALLRGRTELLALVSHELRTPLARIRVALDIAAAGDVGRARQALADINVDLAELERLLGDTLTYSRLEIVDQGGQGTPLSLEEVDPVALLEEAATRFRRSWTTRSLILALEPDLPLLDADRVLLMRVVLNMLENAAKYSPSEQPIVLRASSRGTDMLVEVVDRGEGIAGADQSRAFEPFFRARTALGKATTGGLGLGLTLCRRVVEAHGGTIQVHSEPFEGTTISIQLPSSIDRTAV
jgi:signal transduction histidine kinase